MTTKQTLTALLLLAAGIALFGFLSSRTTPIAPATQEPQTVEASTYNEEGPYLSISVAYPASTPGIRAALEQKMGEEVAQFKGNAKIEELTPEDIQFLGLGEGRKYTLVAEPEVYTSPAYASYAYTVYEDTLGAHPNAHFVTFVFDKEEKLQTLADIIGPDPDYAKMLHISREAQRQVIAELVARLNVPADQASNSYYNEGLSAYEENFRNFVVDGDTLVLLIPPYQAAAYAAGSFEVRIPLSAFSQ